MKYKEGDRVKIKSIDWYNENKDENGDVLYFESMPFKSSMSSYCGKVVTISTIITDDGEYFIKEDGETNWYTDDMIEGLAEEIKSEFKVGDKVRVKSLEWYYNTADEDGWIDLKEVRFNPEMKEFCGKIFTIKTVGEDYYEFEGNMYVWTDEMIEALVEEEYKISDIIMTENYIDFQRGTESKIELNLGDYELKQEGDKWFAIKKKPKYPTTYDECCDVLRIPNDERYIDIDVPLDYNKLLTAFTKLLIYRNAYWKIVGEEMKLGKSWEPDFRGVKTCYVITIESNKILKSWTTKKQAILAFPTEEMRDAFYENFKELINECKELL